MDKLGFARSNRSDSHCQLPNEVIIFEFVGLHRRLVTDYRRILILNWVRLNRLPSLICSVFIFTVSRLFALYTAKHKLLQNCNMQITTHNIVNDRCRITALHLQPISTRSRSSKLAAANRF